MIEDFSQIRARFRLKPEGLSESRSLRLPLNPQSVQFERTR